MIYIDLRYSFMVAKNAGKFNGGNNYAQNILSLLLNKYKDVIAICGDIKVKEYLVDKFKINEKHIIVENDLSKINFIDGSIYFNPQAQDSKQYLNEIINLRNKYQSVKIKMTIHDRRHNEDIIDKYNGVLNEGIKNNYIILGIGRFINSIKKDRIVKQLLNISDEIYTVSNYSMQELLKLGNTKSISYYTQSISFHDEIKCEAENYILFVSGGRSEKNFIRALKAFEIYVKNSGNKEIHLKATGLNERQKETIVNKNIVDKTILNKLVEFYGYMNNDELASMYARCRFLLFTSKSEGYGLPVAEAMFFEKPVVASRKSSIPEVMGSAAIYVDPYSVESIANGLEQMMDEKVYNKELMLVKYKKKIWEKQVELDNKVLIDRINDLGVEKSND